MTTGEFLKRYREAKHLSGRELAFRMGVDQHRMQKWEAGKGNPKLDDSEKIKMFFRLDSLQNISEEVLANRLANEMAEVVEVDHSVDLLLKQKDELLAEKDERISDLKHMVHMLEEQLSEYRTVIKR